MSIKKPFRTGIFLFFFVCVAVSAQATSKHIPPARGCFLPAFQVDERPDPTDRPTAVTVGLRLLDVTAIEDTSQSIAADFVISLSWMDPRLVAFEGCQFDLDEVWTPQIDIINMGRLFTRLRKRVDILDNGRVQYLQRYQGSLVFRYDAHQFPFDRQDIIILLLSIEYGDKDVRLIVDEASSGRRADAFNVADWTITQVKADIVSEPIAAFDRNGSGYTFRITAKRRVDYFVWKVILPLTLIVFMSWTVFWIAPSQLGAQIGMSATSMLTLIAFQFALGDIMPRLSYYTLMDRFILGSTILVFLSLLESVATSHLWSIGKEAMAIRIDRKCRWAFPIVFGVFSLIVFSM